LTNCLNFIAFIKFSAPIFKSVFLVIILKQEQFSIQGHFKILIVLSPKQILCRIFSPPALELSYPSAKRLEPHWIFHASAAPPHSVSGSPHKSPTDTVIAQLTPTAQAIKPLPGPILI